jgi:hypothetical protein
MSGSEVEELPAMVGFQTLSTQLDFLVKSVDELERALQRVLRPSPPSQAAAEKNPGSGTMLLDAIDGVARIVQIQAVRLNEIKTRLVI